MSLLLQKRGKKSKTKYSLILKCYRLLSLKSFIILYLPIAQLRHCWGSIGTLTAKKGALYWLVYITYFHCPEWCKLYNNRFLALGWISLPVWIVYNNSLHVQQQISLMILNVKILNVISLMTFVNLFIFCSFTLYQIDSVAEEVELRRSSNEMVLINLQITLLVFVVMKL